MENSLTKCHRFLYRAALWIGTVMVAVMFVLSLVVQSRVAMDASEKVSFHINMPLAFAFLLCLVGLLTGLRKQIEKLDGKKLYRVCAGVYLVLGLLFILALNRDLRADANALRWTVDRFAEGDFSILRKGMYLSRYPYQLGFVTYERILHALSRNIKLCYVANLLLVLLIDRTAWKISCLLFPDRPFTQNLTILLSFLFLPQFFFLAFVYGTIPGFSMLMLAAYFQIRYLKQQRWQDCLLMAVFGALSCLLKSNYSIGVIALVIVLVLESVRRRKAKWLAAALALVLCVGAGTKTLNLYYETKSGESLVYAEPKILWVAMGLRNKSARMVGWYDSFNKQTHESVGHDPEQSKALAKASITESLERWRDTPGYGFQFFGKKFISTWCDPLFQSLWSGPLADCNQKLDDERLGSLYDDENNLHIVVRQFCQGLLILLYGTALLFLIRELRGKTCDGWLFGIIFMIGGVLFHLVWETKSQYVYPYVFAMIPYMANALESLCETIKGRERRSFKSVLGLK